MTDTPTEELVELLVGESKPVRRMPSLRRSAGIILALGSAAGLLFVLPHGLRADLLEVVAAGGQFSAVGIGLAVVALGGIVAALAMVIPGREATVRAAFAAIALGTLVAVGIGGTFSLLGDLGSLPDKLAEETGKLSGSFPCFSISIVISIAPLAILAVFAGRGVMRHPFALASCAALGGVGFGAFVVHLCCGVDGILHMLLGHALAPFLGVLLLSPLLHLFFKSKLDVMSARAEPDSTFGG